MPEQTGPRSPDNPGVCAIWMTVKLPNGETFRIYESVIAGDDPSDGILAAHRLAQRVHSQVTDRLMDLHLPTTEPTRDAATQAALELPTKALPTITADGRCPGHGLRHCTSCGVVAPAATRPTEEAPTQHGLPNWCGRCVSPNNRVRYDESTGRPTGQPCPHCGTPRRARPLPPPASPDTRHVARQIAAEAHSARAAIVADQRRRVDHAREQFGWTTPPGS